VTYLNRLHPHDNPNSVRQDLPLEQGRIVLMLFLAAAGGALEFYDFVIFIFLADAIGTLFFPAGMAPGFVTLQTFGIFATGYIFRPLGGVVLAHFGDLFGRKRVFAFSILLMALATLAVAFLPTYRTIGYAAPISLVFLRMLQGIAIGGEVPGAWTFAAEHVSLRRMGIGCGLVCVGLNLGTIMGSATTAAMTTLLSPDDVLTYGWRIPFLLGGVFGVFGVYLRKRLRETPIFSAMRAQKLLVPELPLGVVIRDYPAGIFVSIICTWILSAVIVVFTLMIPTILQQLHHIGHEQALIATVIGTISLTVGIIIAGAVLDRIGPAKLFILGGMLLAIGDSMLNFAEWTDVRNIYCVSAVVGLLAGAVVGGVPVTMVRCFPPSVRFTGVSFSYNISYALCGGLTPVLVAVFLTLGLAPHVYYLAFISVLGTALGVYLLFFPEIIAHEQS
jgi:MFS family permease